MAITEPMMECKIYIRTENIHAGRFTDLQQLLSGNSFKNPWKCWVCVRSYNVYLKEIMLNLKNGCRRLAQEYNRCYKAKYSPFFMALFLRFS